MVVLLDTMPAMPEGNAMPVCRGATPRRGRGRGHRLPHALALAPAVLRTLIFALVVPKVTAQELWPSADCSRHGLRGTITAQLPWSIIMVGQELK